MHIMIFQLQDNVFNCIYWPFHSSKEWQIFMALWNLKMHLINNEFYDKLSYTISMRLSSNMSSGANYFNIIIPCVEFKLFDSRTITHPYTLIKILGWDSLFQYSLIICIINYSHVPNEVNQRYIFFSIYKQFVC